MRMGSYARGLALAAAFILAAGAATAQARNERDRDRDRDRDHHHDHRGGPPPADPYAGRQGAFGGASVPFRSPLGVLSRGPGAQGSGGPGMAWRSGQGLPWRSGRDLPWHTEQPFWDPGVPPVVMLPGWSGYRIIGPNGQVWPQRPGGGLYVSRSPVTVSAAPGGDLVLWWRASTDGIARLDFALLDGRGRLLRQEAVTQLPARARFHSFEAARAWRVRIRFVDGSTAWTGGPL